jgi:DNA repair exonuclease SbcCD ATPase subunit
VTIQAQRKLAEALNRAEGLSARVEELEAELDDMSQRCESLRMEDEDAAEAAIESHASTAELHSEIARLRQLLVASDVSAEVTEVQMKERSDLCKQLQQDNSALESRLQHQHQQLQQQQQQFELLQQQLQRQEQQHRQVLKGQKEQSNSPPPLRNRRPSFSDIVAGADSLLLNFTSKSGASKQAPNPSLSKEERMGNTFEQGDLNDKNRCSEILRRVRLFDLIV